MAGDKIIIPENAMIMIHNPWTVTAGNVADLREVADRLDKINETIKSTYLSKAKINEAKLTELMDAETWLSAREAVDYGFADEIEDAKDYAASLNSRFLNFYKNMPLDLQKKAKNKGEKQNKNKELELSKAKLALEMALLI